MIVANKIDLPAAWTVSELDSLVPSEVVEVSATTRQGFGRLRDALAAQLGAGDGVDRDPPAISNVRHLALVERAWQLMQRAGELIDAGATEELILVEITAARQSLEELTGRRTPDDVLRHIFATFCVGK